MTEKEPQRDCPKAAHCLTRKEFLLQGTATFATVLLSSLPGMAHASGKLTLRKTELKKQKIANIQDLKNDTPVYFHYPHQHPSCRSMIVKLGAEAAGGAGAEKDIVAFNLLCTHMGGDLKGTYQAKYKALGPCSIHLTTFDLRRHGMVVAGHATATLPQIILETENDAVYATGMLGLIYGFNDNNTAAP